ncbi:MAG TPA: peptidylprolyl isomerase, partial [Tichowtungia sp.]|nr:peptidylprolyl isomerase [Tichowtungia sp.]
MKTSIRKIIGLYTAVFLTAGFAGAEETLAVPDQPEPEKDTNIMVIMKTTQGDIKLELDAEKAPNTVSNFVSYVERGHYNGTVFHRVIPN